MTDNEKLIEEAKHLIEQAGSFREQAGGAASPTSMIGLWLRTADSLAALMAVFEKAHTPTDDERVNAAAMEIYEWSNTISKSGALMLARAALRAAGGVR